MKAMTIPSYGEPSVLRLVDLPDPTPGERELLIRVKAAGLNPVDTKLRSGAFRAPIELPIVPGFDVSGVVEAVGKGVSNFQAGDEVFASPPLFKAGSHAEYVVIDERLVALKPAGLSHVEAAALPLALITAWEVAHDMAWLRSGQTVLIHAAAGGVGHLLVQLARAAGCTVLATASSPASMGLLRWLGVEHPINYKTTDVAERVKEITDGQGCDAVFDLVGREVFMSSIALVKVRGSLTTIVGIPKDADLTPLFLKSARLNAEFMGAIALAGGVATHQSRILGEAADMVAQNKLKPHVARTFTLDNLAEAHELQETGSVTGKLVIEME